MSINKDQVQRAADSLVRQNKLLEAVEQYTRLLKDNPNDLVTINKVGDLLARAGRTSEAVRHFQNIAEVYTQGGFFLKAIAIYKKILKLESDAVDAMLRLGDLYARQDLATEAREMYLGAARQLESRGKPEGAREVYEKLLRLEPGNVELRTAFADLLRRTGDRPAAAAEMAKAASLLVQQGRHAECSTLFEKALESAKGDAAATASVIEGILNSQGVEQALALAVDLREARPDSPEAIDVLVACYQASGERVKAEEAAKEGFGRTDNPGPATLLVLSRLHARQGRAAEAVTTGCQAVDELIARKRTAEASGAVEEMLEGNPGSVPLLTRRLEIARSEADALTAVETMKSLIGIYEAAGKKHEAKAMKVRLAEAETAAPTVPAAPAAADMPAQIPVSETSEPFEPTATETPAATPPAPVAGVPVGIGQETSPKDDEFIQQHMAEAESLVKYGLKREALEPLEAVVQKYPAHLDAQRLLKEVNFQLGDLKRAVGHSMAISQSLLQAGDVEGAVSELRAALTIAPENEPARVLLGSLAPEEAGGAAGADGEVEITVVDEEAATADAGGNGGLLDLSADLAESLAEALGESEGTAQPEPEEPVESLEDAFAAFRESVKKEVEEEDYSTHYELGIAYREMGLVDEAVNEFEYSSRSTEKFLESCNMLAICHRDKGDEKAAEEWYRRALDSDHDGGAEGAELKTGLAYDLGDLLAGKGDWQSACEVFEKVYERDRNYRDIEERLRVAREHARPAG